MIILNFMNKEKEKKLEGIDRKICVWPAGLMHISGLY